MFKAGILIQFLWHSAHIQELFLKFGSRAYNGWITQIHGITIKRERRINYIFKSFFSSKKHAIDFKNRAVCAYLFQRGD